MKNSWLKFLIPFSIFLFPLLYLGNAFTANVFPKVLFIFSITDIVLLSYLWLSFKKSEVRFKKSYITLGLIFYIVILFIASINGVDFYTSFWSTHLHMLGLVTWIHYFIFFLVLSSLFNKEEDWKNVFRAVAFSGLVLATVSFLGKDGTGMLVDYSFLRKGGSLLGNNSYSGIYYLLVIFISIVGYNLEYKKYWKGFYVFISLFLFFTPDLFNFGILSGKESLQSIASNPALLLGTARTSSLVLWCGLVVTMFLSFVHKLKDKKKVLISAGVLVFGVCVIYLYVFTALLGGSGRIYDTYVKESGLARPLVWQMAEKGIKERPILGYGIGNFSYVFEHNLNPKLIPLEQPPWFDRPHNFVLDQLITAGVLGLVTLLALVGILFFASWKLYLQKKSFYFLFVPFIFLFHFLQIQTSFEIYCSLFLGFILMGFLVSFEHKEIILRTNYSYRNFYRAGGFLLVCISFWFFVVRPLDENRLVVELRDVGTFAGRARVYPSLHNMIIYPPDILRSYTFEYTQKAVSSIDKIEKNPMSLQAVQEEFRSIIGMYDSYENRGQEDYKYLLNYSILLNNAYMFGIDDLTKEAELAQKALVISEGYPNPYWVLAVNAYYKDQKDDALMYAKKAYDIDPTVLESQQIYDTMKKNVANKNMQKTYIYLPEF